MNPIQRALKPIYKHPKVQRAFKKVLFKKYYPSYYTKHAQKPVNPKKVVFVEVRMGYVTDNFKLMYELMEAKGYEVTCCYLKNIVPGFRAYVGRCRQMIKEIADAKYVFLNDACDVFSTVPLRRETIAVQLWHACGAFKKFGMSTAEKIFGASKETLEKYPNYKNLSYVTVSSPEIVWAYEEAMNISPKKQVVQPIGVSRTDVFFNDDFIQQAKDKLYEVFPESKGKKVILYAPTFRGRVKSAKSPDCLDIEQLKEAFGDEYILLTKHHPFVKRRPQIPETCLDFAMDVTKTMEIDELLCVSDICISDYSSLIFEYSLFQRPMIFFAYDLEEYFDWRGFYYNYDEMTPGPIFTQTEEIIDYIKKLPEGFDKAKVEAFKEKFMSACDGHVTQRILELIESTSINKKKS